MRSKSFRFIFILLFSLIACSSGLQSNAQSIDQTLRRRVSSFEVEEISIRRCLEELTARYDFVVGFESLPELQDQPNTIKVRIQNGTVRDVLDALRSQDPRYAWSLSDQAVNVYPITENEPWMRTTIDHFKVDDVNRDGAVEALLKSPEIERQLARASFRRRELRSLPAGVATSALSRFSLDLHQATTRTILNAIAKADHTSVWSYVRYGKHNEYFMFSFTNLMTRVHRGN